MNFLEKMTSAQKSELIINIKNEKGSLGARRAQAIIMLEEGISGEIIEDVTDYKREVVVKYRKIFIKKGYSALVSKRKKKAPNALLKRSQKNEIIKVLKTQKPKDYGFEDYDFWTTTILCQLIEEQYNVKYKSKTPLYLLFKEAKFTFRKPEKYSEKRNDKQIAEWKKQFEPIIKEEYEREDSVVLTGDELVLTSQTRIQKIWLPIEEAPCIQDAAKRKTTHIYGFLNVKTGVAHAFQTPTQTGKETVAVLKQLLSSYPNKRIVIFWDNASWHKSEEVRDYLKITTCFKLYNFPPYAPDLNPQEHVWKEAREKVTNNKLLNNFDKVTKSFLCFINNSLFKYKFFHLPGTSSV